MKSPKITLKTMQRDPHPGLQNVQVAFHIADDNELRTVLPDAFDVTFYLDHRFKEEDLLPVARSRLHALFSRLADMTKDWSIEEPKLPSIEDIRREIYGIGADA